MTQKTTVVVKADAAPGHFRIEVENPIIPDNVFSFIFDPLSEKGFENGLSNLLEMMTGCAEREIHEAWTKYRVGSAS